MSEPLFVGEKRLTLSDIADVACKRRSLQISTRVKERLKKSRTSLERFFHDDKPHYGINTGFGSLKNVRISKEKLDKLQVNIIRSHSVCVGPPLPKEVVRGMMLLKAHMLSQGYSGVRPELVEHMIRMLNSDVVPIVPAQGSVGASGDLAPLAHIALAMMGEGNVEGDGKQMPASEGLEKAGIKPFQPQAKEGLSLLNGTEMMTSLGVLNLLRAENILRHADVAAAMSLEATLGTPRAFDERVQKLRPHPGQIIVASNLRTLLANSEIYESHQDCDRVQDAYSIRCTPQVHGAARDALFFVRSVLDRESNSVTDNPLFFMDENDVISAGNFHGQPVALAMDFLCVALTSVASMSERRTDRLVDPLLSGLPAGLIHDAGYRSGMIMLQVTAAALVSESKTYSHPASVDSIPTWMDQEDHVSMGAFAARKAEHVVDALEKVIAIELICAAQGLDLRKPLRPSRGAGAAVKAVREFTDMLIEDRSLAPDMDRVIELIRSEQILEEVSHAVGPIA